MLNSGQNSETLNQYTLWYWVTTMESLEDDTLKGGHFNNQDTCVCLRAPICIVVHTHLDPDNSF